MMVQVHTDAAGLAMLLAALVRINITDCQADPALAEDLQRRCAAAPGVGFRYRPDSRFLSPRWSTFSVLHARAAGAPIEDDSTGIVMAYAAAIGLSGPGRALFVRVDAAGRATLTVDGQHFDPAALHGAPAKDAAGIGSSCRVDATSPTLSYDVVSPRCLNPRIRMDLLVEVKTGLQGLVTLLAGLTCINVWDCRRDTKLLEDLRRRCYAPAKKGFEYHRDPPYLPDRWSTFAVVSEATPPDEPAEDDCEGMTANYAAGIVLFEPERRVEVCIVQPRARAMAHAFNRIDGGVFDGSVFNAMKSPPPDFYGSGELACFPIVPVEKV